MALTPQDIQQIKEILQGNSNRNYFAGVPRVPPHQHNSIDNLPISSKDITGNLVTKIVAGTNVTISPTTGVGTVTVNSTGGGGGGTPAGSDRAIQYNNAGSFGGSDLILYQDATYHYQTIAVQSYPNNLLTYYGLNIFAGNRNPAYTYQRGGSISMVAGSGDYAGGITLTGGYASNASYGRGGAVTINAGPGAISSGKVSLNSATSYLSMYQPQGMRVKLGHVGASATQIDMYGSFGNSSTPGRIVVQSSDSSIGAYYRGNIYLRAGHSGGVGGNVIVYGYGGSTRHGGNLDIGAITGGYSTNAAWSLIMRNTSYPTGATTGGGILFVHSGALFFMGSSGTQTPLAPA